MSADDEALSASESPPFSEQEIAELDARFAELDSGGVSSIPIAEARRQLRERLDLHLRVRQAI